LQKDSDIEKYIRTDLMNLRAYSPIDPVDVLSESYNIPTEGIIKLDGNENPYGCSPRVRQALSSYQYYNIYPDPEQRELRKVLSSYARVSTESIVAGAGSDELIDLILRLFIEPGDKVINCVPTFGMYPFSTEVCGGRVVNIPRKQSFAVNVAEVKEAVDNRTKVIFIASPNNPTGYTTPEENILELVETGIIVVIDEAYYEFSRETVAPLVSRYDNLIVLRTFSKWAGLAGLRAGYGIFPDRIVPYLMNIKQPYNVNAAAQVAMLESLADIDYLQTTIDAIINERYQLFTRLQESACLKPLPSKANFILCSAVNNDAIQIHQNLKHRGIFTRYFDTPILNNYIRISVGKPEHTEALFKALDQIC
jgi:histidinol-phosphate aminotransferase